MENTKTCPVELAGGFDNRLRRWLQNPEKILRPHIRKGMRALDIGCGPGFFSVEMAKIIGDSGQVFASDLHNGMLDLVREKIIGTELEKRITLHQCQSDKIGVKEELDFALAFYMVHEVPDKKAFFQEILSILNHSGKLLVVEPYVHVSRAEFKKSLEIASEAGFKIYKGPSVFFSRTAILKKD